ncbi:hypothetical protein [Flexithrix dorotheae]|uniref:hypothetical protein n=1 Tax=Flexithrix dorotheae TaxID=70993 RepID=UPI00035FE3F9|nr:hypothetical protein [Flexithrix dorotheae]
MKVFGTLLILLFWFSAGFAQDYIKFVVDSTVDITNHENIKFGVIYDNKKGRKKRVGSLYQKPILSAKFQKMNFYVGEKRYSSFKKEISLNKSLIIEYNGIVPIRYNHPRFPEEIIHDTLIIPVIKDFEVFQQPISYGQKFNLKAKCTYSNGVIKSYGGDDLRYIINRHGIRIAYENAESINMISCKTNPFDGSLENANLKIHISNKNFSKSVEIPFTFGGYQTFNFSASNSSKTYGINGYNGIDAQSVTVDVSPFNDSLYTLKISNWNTTRIIIINPVKFKLKILAKGGNGAHGSSGSSGTSGTIKNLSGTAGGSGGNGGNGGNGAHILVLYPKSFTKHLSCIYFDVSGGVGGNGGYGGSGGDYKYIENGKLKNADKTAPSGPSGNNGNRGYAGLIQYIQKD